MKSWECLGKSRNVKGTPPLRGHRGAGGRVDWPSITRMEQTARNIYIYIYIYMLGNPGAKRTTMLLS